MLYDWLAARKTRPLPTPNSMNVGNTQWKRPKAEDLSATKQYNKEWFSSMGDVHIGEALGKDNHIFRWFLNFQIYPIVFPLR